MVTWWLGCALAAGGLLAASGLGAWLLRGGTATARHQLWLVGIAGALALPLMSWWLPRGTLAPAIAGVSLGTPTTLAITNSATTGSGWQAWLAIAWTAGALIVAIRFARGHLAARRLALGATPWPTTLATHIPVLRSDTVGSPMTVGVVRPRVLLPAVAEQWSPDQLRAALVHELGHVQRRDTATQLVAQLACTLYWWNPLAWLAAARLRVEREHACDDLVLGAGIRASSYAADLLAVARSVSTHRHAAICMADRSATSTRIHRILDASARRGPTRASFRLAVAGLALAATATLACTTPAPPERAAPRGSLVVGAPVVRHPVMVRSPESQQAHLALVTTEVNRRLAPLEQCYARRLAAKPALAGTVVLHWTIAETGAVADACITEDTVGDDALTTCVNELVEAGAFPAPSGGAVDVSFPFVFAPRAAVAAR